MSLLQKFKQFLTDDLKGGGLTLDFIITAEDRKALIREHLTPVIEKELQMTQVADFIWASEYNSMGMRKVISFFHINDAYATLKWGWNFEYIPHYTSKITWCRTDKSIYTHPFELSPKFINRKENNYTVFGKFESKYKNNSEGFQKFVSDHLKVWDTLHEAIVEYYNATSTYEKMLNITDH